MSAPAVYLDPLNQAFVDAAAAFGPLENFTVEQLRAAVEKIHQYEPIPRVTRTDFTVPFEDVVKALIFNPEGCTRNPPVVFYLHGGA